HRPERARRDGGSDVARDDLAAARAEKGGMARGGCAAGRAVGRRDRMVAGGAACALAVRGRAWCIGRPGVLAGVSGVALAELASALAGLPDPAAAAAGIALRLRPPLPLAGHPGDDRQALGRRTAAHPRKLATPPVGAHPVRDALFGTPTQNPSRTGCAPTARRNSNRGSRSLGPPGRRASGWRRYSWRPPARFRRAARRGRGIRVTRDRGA